MKLQTLFTYFLRGLLLVVPTGITVYTIYLLVEWTDPFMPFNIPGLGLLTVLTVTTLLGAVANTFIGKPVFDWINKMLGRIPIVSFIYTSINDLVTAFVGEKKKFDQPVLVPFDDQGILYKPGFITTTDLKQIGLPGKVAVYLPHSYNFSGNVFIVESSKLIRLKGKSTEIMKYIVSGGVSGKIDLKDQLVTGS